MVMYVDDMKQRVINSHLSLAKLLNLWEGYIDREWLVGKKLLYIFVPKTELLRICEFLPLAQLQLPVRRCLLCWISRWRSCIVFLGLRVNEGAILLASLARNDSPHLLSACGNFDAEIWWARGNRTPPKIEKKIRKAPEGMAWGLVGVERGANWNKQMEEKGQRIFEERRSGSAKETDS